MALVDSIVEFVIRRRFSRDCFKNSNMPKIRALVKEIAVEKDGSYEGSGRGTGRTSRPGDAAPE